MDTNTYYDIYSCISMFVLLVIVFIICSRFNCLEVEILHFNAY